jgi:hypothetical protein
MLNSSFLIWHFILQKSTTAPYKSWKKILHNGPQRVAEEAQFCPSSEKVQLLW